MTLFKHAAPSAAKDAPSPEPARTACADSRPGTDTAVLAAVEDEVPVSDDVGGAA